MRCYTLPFFLTFLLTHAAFAGGCALSSPSEFKSDAPCPAETKALMERQDSCEHFALEERTDAERAAFLDQQLKSLRCKELPAEKTAHIQALIAAKDDAALDVWSAYERYAHGQLLPGGMVIDNPEMPANAPQIPDARQIIIKAQKKQR